MIDQNIISSIHKSVSEASSVILILPPEPTPDQVVSALSLHEVFKSNNKQSQIGCSTPISLSNDSINLKEIKDSIGQKNLTISFDYAEEDLEKVDYDVRSNGQFFLVIKPKEGSPVPDISDVKFSYTGAKADLVIVFGISALEELGKIYSDEKEFLDNSSILSLNLSSKPTNFNATTFHNQDFSSYSEMVGFIIEKITASVPSETASNLISEIYSKTQSLSSSKITADTFSTIAYLMRQGGLINQSKSFPLQKFSQPQYFEVPNYNTPSRSSSQPPKFNGQAAKTVPGDWKKPKIFRSNQS